MVRFREFARLGALFCEVPMLRVANGKSTRSHTIVEFTITSEEMELMFFRHSYLPTRLHVNWGFISA